MSLSSLIKTTHAELLELSDEDLRHLKSVYVGILKDIDRTCSTHAIGWSLSGGSILGAVRHGGFIPWDDDIDIFMTRGDFEKFRTVFEAEMGEKYALLLPGDGRNISVFPRIEVKNTLVQSIQSVEHADTGLMLDIFILENTYDNAILRKLHGVLCTGLLFIDSACRTYACRTNLLKYGGENEQLRKAVNKRAFAGRIFSVIKFDTWLRLTDKAFSMVKSDKSRLVVAPGGAKHFFGEIFDRQKMTVVKKVKFEDTEANIPADPDYYLSLRYGKDYMTPPSKQSQEKHVFIRYDLNSTKTEG